MLRDPETFEGPEHHELWGWVDDADKPRVAGASHAVMLLCILHSWAALAGVSGDTAADCFCDIGPFQGEQFRNDGAGIRFIANAVRDAVTRARASELAGGH